jgi:hypothetical protein
LKRLSDLPTVTPDDLLALAQTVADLFWRWGLSKVKVTGHGHGRDDAPVVHGEILPPGDPRIQAHLIDMHRRLPEFIRQGQRDNTLLDIAQKLADRAVPPDEIKAFLLELIHEGRVERGHEFVGELDRIVRQAFRPGRENAIGSYKAPFEEILAKAPAQQVEEDKHVNVPRLTHSSAHSAVSTNQYGRPTASFDNCFCIVGFLNATPRFNSFAGRVEFDQPPE